jgi:hypothetical protein
VSQENVDVVRRGLALLHDSFKSGEATDQLLDLRMAVR